MTNQIKLLYLLHKSSVEVQQHIIDFLRSKDILVSVKVIPEAPESNPWIDVWREFKSVEYQEKVKKEKYDFIISNTHSSGIRTFLNNVSPRMGMLDLEHDLFSTFPEVGVNSTVFACQKKHYDFCVNSGLNVSSCRWPLLDTNISPTNNCGVDEFSDAILIGSYVFTPLIEANKSLEIQGFDKVWYKKYMDTDKVFKDTLPLPKEFSGPIGIKRCLEVCKFVITQQSSCFVETLLLGGLPILLLLNIRKETPINEVLSKVNVVVCGHLVENIHAVTMTNINHKINLLKNDRNLFENARTTMLADWVDKNYFSLPTAHEAIYDFIRKKIENA